MKLVWVSLGLLVAVISVGVACGPTGKYCYADMDTCANVQGKIEQDAKWEAPPPDAAATGTCFDNNGKEIPCGG